MASNRAEMFLELAPDQPDRQGRDTFPILPERGLGLKVLKVRGPEKPSIHARVLTKCTDCASVCQVTGITAHPQAKAYIDAGSEKWLLGPEIALSEEESGDAGWQGPSRELNRESRRACRGGNRI